MLVSRLVGAGADGRMFCPWRYMASRRHGVQRDLSPEVRETSLGSETLMRHPSHNGC